MLKRIIVVVLTGSAIVLNTTTVFLAGSVALGPVKGVDAAIDRFSAERAAEARARIAKIRQSIETRELSPQQVSKVRNMVGRSGPLHSLIVR